MTAFNWAHPPACRLQTVISTFFGGWGMARDVYPEFSIRGPNYAPDRTYSMTIQGRHKRSADFGASGLTCTQNLISPVGAETFHS